VRVEKAADQVRFDGVSSGVKLFHAGALVWPDPGMTIWQAAKCAGPVS
jgi:hypothetical protein